MGSLPCLKLDDSLVLGWILLFFPRGLALACSQARRETCTYMGRSQTQSHRIFPRPSLGHICCLCLGYRWYPWVQIRGRMGKEGKSNSKLHGRDSGHGQRGRLGSSFAISLTETDETCDKILQISLFKEETTSTGVSRKVHTRRILCQCFVWRIIKISSDTGHG